MKYIRYVNHLFQTLHELEKKASALQKGKKGDSADKPRDPYITLIARAILSSSDVKMALGDIYKYITANYSYYDNDEKAWRNSIRYNLSINECFIKAGKEESGMYIYTPYGLYAWLGINEIVVSVSLELIGPKPTYM